MIPAADTGTATAKMPLAESSSGSRFSPWSAQIGFSWTPDLMRMEIFPFLSVPAAPDDTTAPHLPAPAGFVLLGPLLLQGPEKAACSVVPDSEFSFSISAVQQGSEAYLQQHRQSQQSQYKAHFFDLQKAYFFVLLTGRRGGPSRSAPADFVTDSGRSASPAAPPPNTCQSADLHKVPAPARS